MAITTWLLALLLSASPLVEAVKARDAAAVRDAIERGAAVNEPEPDGATALHWAAYGGDLEIVEALLAAGAKADVANDLAITPLHLAAAGGHAALVDALLRHGARPNARSESGVTPLMEAARTGSTEAVRALIARGADVDAAESARGQTALMWAASRRHPAVVRALVAAGADVHARTGVRPLTVMLDQGPRRSVKTSVQDARQIHAGGVTAIFFAALSGDAESARLLTAAGARVTDTAADGHAALAVAAMAGHGAVVRALLDAGADPDASGGGFGALHAAALRGDLGSVRALLAAGADPNARLTRGSPVRRFGSQWALPSTMAGATPLFVAATYLEVEVVRALLAAGAMPEVALASGTSPLLAAAGVAVERSARPSDLDRWNIVDSDTPAVPRDEAEVSDTVRALLDAGADVNAAGESGDTALHAAAGAGLTSVIQLLADRGAALDVRNANGQTPLALTLPRGPAREGRAPVAPGFKAAEELLRRLGAQP